MKKYLSVLTFLITSLTIAQGAWIQKKGEKYIQLSYTTINKYSEVFGKPDYLTEREVTDNTIQLYGEFGINEKTTLIVNVPIKYIETGTLVNKTTATTTAQTTTDLGNIEIGIKRPIYSEKWVVSGQANLEVNTSLFYNESGIRTSTNAWSLTPTINVGRSFKRFYTQGFTGVNIKTNGYSSSFKIGGEIGIKPFKPILLVAFVDILKSFNNGTINLPPSNTLTSLYVNNQEYGAYGLKAIGKITKKFGANAAFGGAFFGNNVAKKVALTFGLYHKL